MNDANWSPDDLFRDGGGYYGEATWVTRHFKGGKVAYIEIMKSDGTRETFYPNDKETGPMSDYDTAPTDPHHGGKLRLNQMPSRIKELEAQLAEQVAWVQDLATELQGAETKVAKVEAERDVSNQKLLIYREWWIEADDRADAAETKLAQLKEKNDE